MKMFNRLRKLTARRLTAAMMMGFFFFPGFEPSDPELKPSPEPTSPPVIENAPDGAPSSGLSDLFSGLSWLLTGGNDATSEASVAPEPTETPFPESPSVFDFILDESEDEGVDLSEAITVPYDDRNSDIRARVSWPSVSHDEHTCLKIDAAGRTVESRRFGLGESGANADYYSYIDELDESGNIVKSEKYRVLPLPDGTGERLTEYFGYTTFSYDSRGNITDMRTYSSADVMTECHYYIYGPDGKILSETVIGKDGLLKEQISYERPDENTEDRIRSINGEDGLWCTEHVTNEYKDGLLLSETHYRADNTEYYSVFYDASGNPASLITYHNGRTAERYVFASEAHDPELYMCLSEYVRCSESGEILDHKLYAYDENGNRVQAMSYSAEGMLEFYQLLNFDDNGSLRRVDRKNADGILLSYCMYEYDADGILTGKTHYNPIGIEISDPDLAPKPTATPTATPTASPTPTPTPKAVETERVLWPYPGEQRIVQKVDGMGRILSETEYLPSGNVSDDGRVYEYLFDKNGRITERIESSGKSGKVTGYTTYTFDSSGSLTETRTYEDDELVSFHSYDYASNGNLLSENYIGPGGDTALSYIYDYSSYPSVIADETVSRVGDEQSAYKVDWEYDRYNRLKSEIRVSTENGATLSARMYDSDENLIFAETHFSDGSIRQSMAYEPDFRLTKYEEYSEDGILTAYYTFEYDASGNRVQTNIYGDNGAVDYVDTFHYDKDGRIIRAERKDSHDRLVSYRVIDYDARGNWVRSQEYDASGKVLSPTTGVPATETLVPADFYTQSGWIPDSAIAKLFYKTGMQYLEGDGVVRNYVLAAKYLYRAAELNHSGAQYAIGYICENGFGVHADSAEAAEWYLKAARKGNAAAQNRLGSLYLKGNGVTRSETTAAEWFRLAANGGNAYAMLNLGHMHFSGIAVEQNYGIAAEWYKKAASAGLDEANGYYITATDRIAELGAYPKDIF